MTDTQDLDRIEAASAIISTYGSARPESGWTEELLVGILQSRGWSYDITQPDGDFIARVVHSQAGSEAIAVDADRTTALLIALSTALHQNGQANSY